MSGVPSPLSRVPYPISIVNRQYRVVYPIRRLSSIMWVAGAQRRPCGRRNSRSDVIQMQSFRTLEHTADVGFEAFGSTREEVFANAGRALMNIIVDLDSIEAREEVPLQISGPDPESVLVNWLSEILYLHDAEGWLFRDFEIQSLQDNSLRAMARGEKFLRPRHQAKLLVKAITYHQLALEENPQGWRAQVYVDI